MRTLFWLVLLCASFIHPTAAQPEQQQPIVCETVDALFKLARRTVSGEAGLPEGCHTYTTDQADTVVETELLYTALIIDGTGYFVQFYFVTTATQEHLLVFVEVILNTDDTL